MRLPSKTRPSPADDVVVLLPLSSPRRPSVFRSAVRSARVFQLSHIPPDHRKSVNPQRTDNLTSPDTPRSNTVGGGGGERSEKRAETSETQVTPSLLPHRFHTFEINVSERLMPTTASGLWFCLPPSDQISLDKTAPR